MLTFVLDSVSNKCGKCLVLCKENLASQALVIFSREAGPAWCATYFQQSVQRCISWSYPWKMPMVQAVQYHKASEKPGF